MDRAQSLPAWIGPLLCPACHHERTLGPDPGACEVCCDRCDWCGSLWDAEQATLDLIIAAVGGTPLTPPPRGAHPA